VTALLVLITILLGMDPKEVKVVIEVAMERVALVASEGEAEKDQLEASVELEEMALQALTTIQRGMDHKEAVMGSEEAAELGQ
jgi:hypothetical protein